MQVIKNKDEMSQCTDCLDRAIWAEVIMVIGGMSIKLCSNCRKKLMTKLVNEF